MSSEMIDMVLADAADKMAALVAHARSEFSTVRTGRASPTFIEKLPVEAYGVSMSVQELASFSVPEARQLLVTPHDPANLEAIERSIMSADLGLTPSNDGRTIRLSFPPLTAERRKDLVRLVNAMAEEHKNRLRGLRRSARKDLDDVEEDGGVSSDEIQRAEARLDKVTHDHEAGIEAARGQKEEELLEV